MKRSFATLLGLALLAALVPVVALASCAAADTQIRLAGFDADVEGAQVYVAVEGQSPAGTLPLSAVACPAPTKRIQESTTTSYPAPRPRHESAWQAGMRGH